jgi:uncharacterized protein (TIGR02444 family)
MTADSRLEPDALWSYAVELYGRNGVADACLGLQDEHGLDVPALLACVWAATELGVAERSMLSTCLDATATWRSSVVDPLRAVRRSLKAPIEPFDREAQHRLRTEVAELELKAERQQLDVLQQLVGEMATEPVGSPEGRVRRFLGGLASWAPMVELSCGTDRVTAIVGAAVPELERAAVNELVLEFLA